MKHEYSMRSLHIAGFARDGASLQTTIPLSEMPRLLQESARTEVQTDATMVDCAATGSMMVDAAGQQEPWMHLVGRTHIAMVCQRCLAVMDVPIAFERDFRFVANEALAEVEDEESDEDVLVISKNFDVVELVEDELIMAMPVAPMHTVCPRPVKLQAADADFEAPEQEKPNPFAVLQKLKSPKT